MRRFWFLNNVRLFGYWSEFSGFLFDFQVVDNCLQLTGSLKGTRWSMSGIVVTATKHESADSTVSRFGKRMSNALSRMSTDGRQSSLRSWSGDRSADVAEGPSSLARPFDTEDELAEVEYLPKEEEVPYIAAPINFVRITYGASQTLLLNSDCRRKIFTNYLMKKIGARNRISGAAVIDLCTEDGTLLRLESVDANGNIDHLFQHGDTYIPCIVTRTGVGTLESIKPCLKHWEKLYPSLEDVFNKVIQYEQEEARNREQTLATITAITLHVEDKKEKERESDHKSEKKKKGK